VERHAAVGAGIAQSEWLSHPITPNHQRDLQQGCPVQLIAVHAISRESTIPEAGEHERISGLALREIKFGHGYCRLLIVDC
jgi:hypothetical protein